MARTALVTGGTRGIGASIAKALKDAGHTVVVGDIVDDQLASFESETGIRGFNNAGITRDGFMHKMDPVKQWDAVIKVNLSSVFNTCRVVAPGMRDRGFGRIVNVSSMNGQRGQFGQSNYSAAKAGMIGFTKAVAQELANKGVTANCVAPGFILTEMTAAMPPEILDAEVKKIPMGRIGQPDDIASMTVFLASEEAGWITGQVMSVNGGQLMP